MAAQTTEEILAEYEELFANRYTEQDVDYMKVVKKTPEPPPCVDDWLNAGNSRRDDRRDRSGGRYGDRYHPYQRNDRQGDRYGDRHGDRYGNRSYDHYNDRLRYDSHKKATDYGSQGYYQYYY